MDLPKRYKETNVFQKGAIEAGIEEAGEKATKYITELSDGIMVHPENDNTTGWSIRDALELIRSGISMFKVWFEDNLLHMRIGSEESSNLHLTDKSIFANDANGEKVFEIYAGDSEEVRYTEYSATVTPTTLIEHTPQNERYVPDTSVGITAVLTLVDDSQVEAGASYTCPELQPGNLTQYSAARTARKAASGSIPQTNYNITFTWNFGRTVDGDYYLSGLAGIVNRGDYIKYVSFRFNYTAYRSDVKFPTYTLGIRDSSDSIGDYSFAEGYEVTASGIQSHAEGCNTVASGAKAHAEGHGTTASGSTSHAEGGNTEALGEIAHAEGGATSAIGICSHAEGAVTEAVGDYSHAEGNGTHAIGRYAHAEGTNTEANGISSHAEGYETVADGTNSHAQNKSTIAAGANQTAIGKYNEEDSNDTYALIIGGGSSDTARKNILTLDWYGHLMTRSLNDNDIRYPIHTATTDGRQITYQAAYNNLFHVAGQWGQTNHWETRTISMPSSDVRLKKNIEDCQIDALETINKIRVREFDWLHTREHQKIGFVADELEQLDPKLSVGGGYEKDGTMNVKSVDTFYLMGYLVKAIQEQQQQIATLTARIEKLEEAYE